MISHTDLKPVIEIGGQFASGTYRFPRKAYRGELRTDGPNGGNRIANIYLLDQKIYVAEPREFGGGEIERMLPGTFEPNQFEYAGGYNVSSTHRVDFWRFK
jgi:hypothetical protein